MNQHENICPECFADTLLIESLGFKKPNHAKGITVVADIFLKPASKNKLIIGVVDNDNRLPFSFNDFEELDNRNGLLLKQLKGTRHYLIFICPALEKWILFNCNQVDASPEKYRLPTSFVALGKIFKSQNVGENQQVKTLFNDLKQKKAPGFVTLFEWIETILEG